MNGTRTLLCSAMTVALASGAALLPTMAGSAELEPIEELGRQIFFDNQLSLRKNQSCASCHVPEAGWVGDDTKINEAGGVYEGSIKGEFGNRNPPSSAYATVSPLFDADDSEDPADPLFFGGNFWDGRATGWKLGNPAADQAQGPFLNPVEQALPDAACVVYRVCEGPYGDLFDEVWGTGACDIDWRNRGTVNNQCVKPDGEVSLSPADRAKVNDAYDLVALSIEAFEASPVSNAYTSKIDAVRAGLATFTEQELKGRALFRENGKGKCALCHVGSPPDGPSPLFTDFTYDNLGVPRNPLNPASIADPTWADPGLGGFLAGLPENPAVPPEYADFAEHAAQFADANLGKHKVPTLRNAGLGSCESLDYDDPTAPKPSKCVTKAYMHNGYFKSLWQVVHFYNTRDVKVTCESLGIDDATVEVALANDCWPEPEVAATVNKDELGDLGLSTAEELALVAFMMAMSDGYRDLAP
jgi:cytochrome c peroxidase